MPAVKLDGTPDKSVLNLIQTIESAAKIRYFGIEHRLYDEKRRRRKEREREVGHRKARSLREPVSPPSPLVGIYGQPRSSRSSRWIFSNINKRAPAKCSTVIYRLFRALLAAYITRCLRVRASMLSCNRPSKEETFRVLTSTRASRTPIFNRAGGKIGPMIGPGLGDGVHPAD